MRQGKYWDLEEYMKIKNVEHTNADEEYVIQHFEITASQMSKVRLAMRKRHPESNWIAYRKNKIAKVNVRTIALEGIVWMADVYFREKDENYLDAEIRFEKRNIARLEKELNKTEHDEIYDDQSLSALAKTLSKSYNGVKKKITERQHNDNSIYLYKNENGMTMVKSPIVKWCIENDKNYQRKKLHKYKLELQNEKEQRRKGDDSRKETKQN